MVRSRLAEAVRLQVKEKGVDNVVLILGVKDALQRVPQRSLFWVLESFKAMDSNLVEEVNQVRRYRNWIARKAQSVPAGCAPGHCV